MVIVILKGWTQVPVRRAICRVETVLPDTVIWAMKITTVGPLVPYESTSLGSSLFWVQGLKVPKCDGLISERVPLGLAEAAGGSFQGRPVGRGSFWSIFEKDLEDGGSFVTLRLVV